MSHILFQQTFEDIISTENLLEAWQEFVKGKRTRSDVQLFECSLMEQLFLLHENLSKMTYTHDPYEAFVISDPKTRHIHKASVADRVLHRAIYRKLYPFFDRTFISDSFSCRMNKGTHRALDRFNYFSRKVSHNHYKTVWVLKCDIQKFFASIDQKILLHILDSSIPDKRLIWLLEKILFSFSSGQKERGLPLGNLTSQVFANVYMNVFDHFVKQNLHVKYYIRYADDFVFFSQDKGYLECILPLIQNFLSEKLHLLVHPKKIELKTVASGVDFLGWVHFPYHRVLRTATKNRMFRNLEQFATPEKITSYLGLMNHGDTFELKEKINLYNED